MRGLLPETDPHQFPHFVLGQLRTDLKDPANTVYDVRLLSSFTSRREGCEDGVWRPHPSKDA